MLHNLLHIILGMEKKNLKTGIIKAIKKVRVIILILIFLEIIFNILSLFFMKNGNSDIAIIFNLIQILVIVVCFVFVVKLCCLLSEQKNENKKTSTDDDSTS
jgi:hypothetical protein